MLETIGNQIGLNKKKERSLSDSLPKTPKENDIENRDSEASSHLGGGANDSHFVKLKDDGSVIFKPRNGESDGLRIGQPGGTYYKCERAAYLMDKFLGFGLVPPTVIRSFVNSKGEVEEGSAQEFVENASFFGEHGWQAGDERFKLLEENLKTQWLLDLIIWNSDRHKYNLLIKNDGSIVSIDHGLSFYNTDIGGRFFILNNGKRFHSEEPTRYDSHIDDEVPNEFYGGYFGIPLPQESVDKIKKLAAAPENLSLLKDLLSELIPADKARACIQRIKRIAAAFEGNMLPISTRDNINRY